MKTSKTEMAIAMAKQSGAKVEEWTPPGKDIIIRMTHEQASAWLEAIADLKRVVSHPVSDEDKHYDRLNRLHIQLETALKDVEAFGVTQAAGCAHIEVSL